MMLMTVKLHQRCLLFACPSFYLNTCCFFTVITVIDITIIDIIIIITVVIIIVTAISAVIISPTLSESIIVTMMKQDHSEWGVLVLKFSFCLHFMIFSMNIFVFPPTRWPGFLTFNWQLITLVKLRKKKMLTKKVFSKPCISLAPFPRQATSVIIAIWRSSSSTTSWTLAVKAEVARQPCAAVVWGR